MKTEFQFPQGNFHVPHIVDETLREGVERTAFPITTDTKFKILQKMTDAGLRDFVVGCGPERPSVWQRLHQERENGILPHDTKATYIILLNCWETAFSYFNKLRTHENWIADTVFSFGMITYKEREKTFFNALSAFSDLGAKTFKASVLNNFRTGVSEERYGEICRQIDQAIALGVKIIRINDSVGSLQPATTHWMCSRLVKQYPDITFCLHAHNDTGLAVANAIQSVQSGFQMIEGSLAGFGNRSGISPIEQVVRLCKNNNITLGDHDIDSKKLVEAARFCEEALLQVPNVYRPVGGIFETDSNFGVLNIPDFLETRDEKEYFVNYVGLHPETLRQALKKHYPEINFNGISSEKQWEIIHNLQREMEFDIDEMEDRYRNARRILMDFYRTSTFTTKKLADFTRASLDVDGARHGKLADSSPSVGFSHG